MVLIAIWVCLMSVKYLTRKCTSNVPWKYQLIKKLNTTRNINDLHMVIEGLDQITHLIQSVPPCWRFYHHEPQIRSNFLK